MDAPLLLSYGNAAGELCVFGRLASLGLLLRYRWFAAWMAFSAARDFSILIATSSRLRAPAYWSLWQLTEPVALGLTVLAAFEAYDLIVRSVLGPDSFGAKVLKVAVTVGVAVSVVATVADLRGISPWMFEAKRAVTLTLAVALMCVSWVFLWADRPLRRNLVRHCRILTVYLSAVASGYFLMNVGVGRSVAAVLFLSVCLACLALWAVIITKEGERVPTAILRTETPPEGANQRDGFWRIAGDRARRIRQAGPRP